MQTACDIRTNATRCTRHKRIFSCQIKHILVLLSGFIAARICRCATSFRTAMVLSFDPADHPGQGLARADLPKLGHALGGHPFNRRPPTHPPRDLLTSNRGSGPRIVTASASTFATSGTLGVVACHIGQRLRHLVGCRGHQRTMKRCRDRQQQRPLGTGLLGQINARSTAALLPETHSARDRSHWRPDRLRPVRPPAATLCGLSNSTPATRPSPPAHRHSRLHGAPRMRSSRAVSPTKSAPPHKVPNIPPANAPPQRTRARTVIPSAFNAAIAAIDVAINAGCAFCGQGQRLDVTFPDQRDSFSPSASSTSSKTARGGRIGLGQSRPIPMVCAPWPGNTNAMLMKVPPVHWSGSTACGCAQTSLHALVRPFHIAGTWQCSYGAPELQTGRPRWPLATHNPLRRRHKNLSLADRPADPVADPAGLVSPNDCPMTQRSNWPAKRGCFPCTKPLASPRFSWPCCVSSGRSANPNPA